MSQHSGAPSPGLKKKRSKRPSLASQAKIAAWKERNGIGGSPQTMLLQQQKNPTLLLRSYPQLSSVQLLPPSPCASHGYPASVQPWMMGHSRSSSMDSTEEKQQLPTPQQPQASTSGKYCVLCT